MHTIIEHVRYLMNRDTPSRTERNMKFRFFDETEGTIIIEDFPDFTEIIKKAISDSNRTFNFKMGIFISNPNYQFNKKKSLRWAKENLEEQEAELMSFSSNLGRSHNYHFHFKLKNEKVQNITFNVSFQKSSHNGCYNPFFLSSEYFLRDIIARKKERKEKCW